VKSECTGLQKQLKKGHHCHHKDITGGKVKAIHWCEGWIPMVVDLVGNFTFIDLAPGEKGIKGQIIFGDHDFGTEVMNKSYLEYLEEVAGKFERERYAIKGDWLYEKDEEEDEKEKEIIMKNIKKVMKAE